MHGTRFRHRSFSFLIVTETSSTEKGLQYTFYSTRPSVMSHPFATARRALMRSESSSQSNIICIRGLAAGKSLVFLSCKYLSMEIFIKNGCQIIVCHAPYPSALLKVWDPWMIAFVLALKIESKIILGTYCRHRGPTVSMRAVSVWWQNNDIRYTLLCRHNTVAIKGSDVCVAASIQPMLFPGQHSVGFFFRKNISTQPSVASHLKISLACCCAATVCNVTCLRHSYLSHVVWFSLVFRQQSFIVAEEGRLCLKEGDLPTLTLVEWCLLVGQCITYNDYHICPSQCQYFSYAHHTISTVQ
jgi:hypothetical protein